MSRWDTTVACSRPDCEGFVHVRGYAEPASMYGGADHTGWPAEGENEVSACDTCGTDDWTDKELSAYEDTAREQSGDDDRYDGPDTLAERDL